MRRACPSCGHAFGRIENRSNQDCVFCSECDKFQYNAPKTETGREPRTVTTIHELVGPKHRARILVRDGFSCVLCHSRNKPLHVGHLLSVSTAARLHESGWLSKPFTDEQINDDENLAAMCDECNWGLGRETVPLYLLMGIFLARLESKRRAV